MFSHFLKLKGLAESHLHIEVVHYRMIYLQTPRKSISRHQNFTNTVQTLILYRSLRGVVVKLLTSLMSGHLLGTSCSLGLPYVLFVF